MSELKPLSKSEIFQFYSVLYDVIKCEKLPEPISEGDFHFKIDFSSNSCFILYDSTLLIDFMKNGIDIWTPFYYSNDKDDIGNKFLTIKNSEIIESIENCDGDESYFILSHDFRYQFFNLMRIFDHENEWVKTMDLINFLKMAMEKSPK